MQATNADSKLIVLLWTQLKQPQANSYGITAGLKGLSFNTEKKAKNQWIKQLLIVLMTHLMRLESFLLCSLIRQFRSPKCSWVFEARVFFLPEPIFLHHDKQVLTRRKKNCQPLFLSYQKFSAHLESVRCWRKRGWGLLGRSEGFFFFTSELLLFGIRATSFRTLQNHFLNIADRLCDLLKSSVFYIRLTQETLWNLCPQTASYLTSGHFSAQHLILVPTVLVFCYRRVLNFPSRMLQH